MVYPDPSASAVPTPVRVLAAGSEVVLANGVRSVGGPALIRAEVAEGGRVLTGATRLDAPGWDTRYRAYLVEPCPDGRYAAVESVHGDAGHSVRVVDLADGRVWRCVGEQVFVHFLDWHPDGRRMLMRGFEAALQPGNLVVVDVESGKEEVIEHPKETLERHIAVGGSFSPDGEKVAVSYVDGSRMRSQVWVLSLDGASRLLYTTEEARVEQVSWSPAGEWIAMTEWRPRYDVPERDGDYTGDLILMGSEGREEVRVRGVLVCTGHSRALWARWDPVGERLAFLVGGNSGEDAGVQVPVISDVRVWEAQTRRVTQMTDDEGMSRLNLSWSPDGAWLLYTERRIREEEVFRSVAVQTATREQRTFLVPDALDTHLDTYSRVAWSVVGS